MRYKASFLSGLAAGYVLGARAGRERYEQISQAARTTWENPRVRRTAGAVGTKTGHFVGSAAQVARDRGKAAKDKGKAVSGRVSEKMSEKLPARLADKLPSSFTRHRADEGWKPYAHTGHNEHLSAPGTPGL